MKKLALTLALGLATTGMAFAQGISDMDADGTGNLSMSELQAVYPNLTEEGFTAIDTNADGAVDEAELAAAVEAGTLKTEG
ncbi:EF-hand domain-containing protein [Defluviimonas sp. SAOS-178_SWC]|uniref:EF-hand domain-containing protein n=1 Tax=Defluviimonas sp. SAOS-178_SWC TaxID=3121287 RepID=UPI003221E5DD